MKLKPWLQLFRLPNLPTAPGDALAGAAVAFSVGAMGLSQALVAGLCALLFYMFGLADNDICDAKDDEVSNSTRPIPSGTISLNAAKFARSVCWGLSLILGALFNLPPAWWVCSLLLVITILLYNRFKNRNRFLALTSMGLCRGLNLACGALAVNMPFTVNNFAILSILVFGWATYIAAVTKLAENEEHASPPIPATRFLGAITALIPLGALFFLPDMRSALIPSIGCIFTCLSWCIAVAPLGYEHTPDVRRRAVGQTIGALLYLQIGFMLICPARPFFIAAIILWLSARIIRKFAPEISGS